MSLPVSFRLRTDKVTGDRRFGGPLLTISLDDKKVSIKDTLQEDLLPIIVMQHALRQATFCLQPDQIQRWQLCVSGRYGQLSSDDKRLTCGEVDLFIKHKTKLAHPNQRRPLAFKKGERVGIVLTARKESLIEGTIYEVTELRSLARR